MTRTVLIIDDEDDIREIASLALELGAGWTVLSASTGAAGIALAAGARPDAILLDVMMPGLDGPATLERLRSSDTTRGIPVVFLTAKVRASERDRLAALGAAGVLPKPFDPLSLHTQIESILEWAA